MAELVAWSPIHSAKNNGTNKEPEWEAIDVKPGDPVTQDGVNVDDAGWKQLIESGAVRAQEYPNMPETWQDSPVQFLRDQARKAAEGLMDTATMSEENMAAVMAANNAETGVALLPEGVEPAAIPSEATTSNSTTQFMQGREGLLASDDGGNSWRPATEEEKAAQS